MEIIPVIHIVNDLQVHKNIQICSKNGIKKIFLIDHSGSEDRVVSMLNKAKAYFPGMWVGVNFLQPNAYEDFKMLKVFSADANALWVDNSGLVKEPDDSLAVEVDNYRKENSLDKVLYFGGIEFKYQKQPSQSDLEWVYKKAIKYIEVITTSGPGTGKPAQISKLERIRNLIGNHPLAVASGVDYINKPSISKYVDYVLVASSITENGTELISEDRLKKLLDS